MANRDAPFGLRPVKHLNGNPWNGKVRHYYVPATDNTAIYIGDPVTHVGDSNDNEVLGCPPGSLLEVTRTTVGDGNAITGVVVGVVPVTADSLKYRAASTERVLMVVDDPSVVFEIQADTTGLTADSMGLDAVLIATHSGSTTTGLSGMELDTTSDVPAADSSNQLRIISLAKKQDNELGAWCVAEVYISNHTNAQGNVSIGIA
jgi:hypothetical protein